MLQHVSSRSPCRPANPRRCPSASTRRSPRRAAARASPAGPDRPPPPRRPPPRSQPRARPTAWSREPHALGSAPAPARSPRQPQPTIRTRASALVLARRGGAAPRASARSSATWARMSSSVISGRPVARRRRVLGLEHLVHVVELQLGLDLGRTGRAPVHLLGPRARIPAAEREEDPDQDQHAEHDERRELVHARPSVRSAPPCPTPSSSTRCARRSAATAACSRACGPTISPPTSIARGRRAQRHRPPQPIDEVYMGCANQAGEDNRNVARMASLLAGLPVEVPGVTVNRLCASGLEAVDPGRAADPARRGGPRARRRRRVHDARAARDAEAGARLPARRRSSWSTPRSAGASSTRACRAPLDRVDGRDRRERGRALRRLARGPGRVRARVAPARGRRRRGGPASTTRSSRSTCPSRRATRSRPRRRGPAARTPRSSGSRS